MKYYKLFNISIFYKATPIALIAFIMSVWNPLTANHSIHRYDTDSRLSGHSLEHDLWHLVQTHDDKFEELISPLFLGRNTQGIRNYDAEIEALKNLSITSFAINNIIESQDEDIRIISYDFTATGANPINDHRISVWQRKKHKHHQFFWQLISHSNFSSNT